MEVGAATTGVTKAESVASTKTHKIEADDRWTDSNSAGFKAFRLKAERYLLSAKPYYAEDLKIMMQHVQFKDNVVDLKEMND